MSIHPSAHFTTGTLVKGEQAPPAPTQTASESYVPAAFARQRIEEIATDMQQMRTEHQSVLQSVCDHFTEVERQTQQHYTDFVKELQRKAQLSLAHMKRELRQTREAAADYKQQATAQIESLELSVTKKIEENRLRNLGQRKLYGYCIICQ